MTDFQVTPANLLSKVQELDTQNAQLKAQIKRLEEIELRLNGMTTWEGDASTAFHAVFEQDKVKLTNYCTAIQGYIQALRNAAARYTKAENQNIDLMNAGRHG